MRVSFILLLFIVGCSLKPKVKEEVIGLQNLKTECDNLQIELESLGAKKWTKVIDNKVKQCKDHGFWRRKDFKKAVKDFTEGLDE